jgi:hypothetical protein
MSLLTNLESYWRLDEASGSALDAHGANHLTETSGTIASTTGKVGNCRDLEAGDTEHFEISDNAALSTGDIDFTLTGWVNIESISGNAWIVSKWNGTINQREYGVRVLDGSPDLFQFFVSSNGTASASVSATTFGAPSLATWYFFVAWHDASANTINIQINNGTVNSTAHATGVFNSTAPFRLGAQGNDSEFFDGLIDEVGFWKRILTSDERTAIYNGGNGLAYPFASGHPAVKRMGGVRFASHQQIGHRFGGVW